MTVRLNRASGMAPAAGLVIALCPGLAVLLLSAAGANAALTAILALLILIGVTGALHEDGLADCADALGARGGRDKMLDIMKDSRIGTYGVLALLLSFSLRAVALTIILSVAGGWGAFWCCWPLPPPPVQPWYGTGTRCHRRARTASPQPSARRKKARRRWHLSPAPSFS
jgi:cobalamin synthase